MEAAKFQLNFFCCSRISGRRGRGSCSKNKQTQGVKRKGERKRRKSKVRTYQQGTKRRVERAMGRCGSGKVPLKKSNCFCCSRREN